MDKKNASGVSHDLRKNEAICWEDHPTLNAVTKASLGYYE
jgi:hypothetical protein